MFRYWILKEKVEVPLSMYKEQAGNYGLCPLYDKSFLFVMVLAGRF